MNTCRACQSDLPYLMANLGCTPLANSYIEPGNERNEQSYPLEVRVCGNCHLAQVIYAVNPADIFLDYAYFSSFSSSWLDHAKSYCEKMIDKEGLNSNSLVVEIASNDGYLLKNFVGQNIPVLGVEPAQNIAQIANQKGIRTEACFFGESEAIRLKEIYGQANLIAANNVLAHVPDICDFINGMAVMLHPDGLLTFEFPHLLRLIEDGQFDTIYHEHYSYLSVTTVDILLRQVGLFVSDLEELRTHGGSVRLYIKHISSQANMSDRVKEIKTQEEASGLTDGSAYPKFNETISSIKMQLTDFLHSAKSAGHSIVGYGAAAKGNTLLNFCQINRDTIDFVVDLNGAKQNKLLPGSHIPVVAKEELLKSKPDYILILPWNLKEEVISQLEYCREWGAKFVIAVPKLEVY